MIIPYVYKTFNRIETAGAFIQVFKIKWRRWHLETFLISNHSRLFPCSSAGTNKSPSSANIYNFMLFWTKTCTHRVVHLMNKVKTTSSWRITFPSTSAKPVKIPLLENILSSPQHSPSSLFVSLSLPTTQQSPFQISKTNLSSSSLWWRRRWRSRSVLVWKSTRRSTRNGSTSPIQVWVRFR